MKTLNTTTLVLAGMIGTWLLLSTAAMSIAAEPSAKVIGYRSNVNHTALIPIYANDEPTKATAERTAATKGLADAVAPMPTESSAKVIGHRSNVNHTALIPIYANDAAK